MSRLARLVSGLCVLLAGSAVAQEAPQQKNDDDGVHVVLCFSGGGTRAAAFALGAARGLAEVDAGGVPLLERVDRLVGVSGGSLTAAQVALDRSPEALARFESVVLRDDMEVAMVKAAAADGFALAFRDLTRGDVAAGCFHERLRGTTFRDLPARPELWIQTTDMVARRPLVLSRESLAQLDLQPADMPVARAVAASAAFPGVFPPLRCVAAVTSGAAPLWLADGGIVDNLGLEPALQAVPADARAVVVIVVNSRNGLTADETTLRSSLRSGIHALELQQRRLDELVLGRARDRLRILELEGRLAGRPVAARLVELDFAGSTRREALEAIATRFALDDEEVTLLLEEGRSVARARGTALSEAWASQ